MCLLLKYLVVTKAYVPEFSAFTEVEFTVIPINNPKQIIPFNKFLIVFFIFSPSQHFLLNHINHIIEILFVIAKAQLYT